MVRRTFAFFTISRKFFSTKPKGYLEIFAAKQQYFISRKLHSFKPLLHQATSTIMQSSKDSNGDHLTRTSKNSRDAEIHSMVVKEINALSPTIKEVVILVSESTPPTLTFKAGQWVDVFIPNVNTVGGFSMCSSPQEMTSFGQLRLAIKYSTHPPALWMHEKCQVGVKLKVRVGGDFYLSWEVEPTFKKILLIAGGVGINPLCSMIHYVLKGFCGAGIKMILLYSARTKEELIFKDVFDKYCNENHDFAVKYFITDKSQPLRTASKESESDFQRRRMSALDLQSSINWLKTPIIGKADNADVEAFICGPPTMITECKDELLALKIPSIHFEKWW